jgi:hypothetical protein
MGVKEARERDDGVEALYLEGRGFERAGGGGNESSTLAASGVRVVGEFASPWFAGIGGVPINPTLFFCVATTPSEPDEVLSFELELSPFTLWVSPSTLKYAVSVDVRESTGSSCPETVRVRRDDVTF